MRAREDRVRKDGGFASVPAAWRGGFREALGSPALVLGAGYVGFGALARDADISLLLAAVSTLSIFALPAQIAMIELWQGGAAFVPLVLAVMMTSARFLPMAATLLPSLRHPRWSAPHYVFAAHCIAMTGWAVAMRRAPQMAADQRLPFFCAFTIALWAASLAGTVLGYFLSGLFTGLLTLGLVFLNPIYFLLILIRETRTRLGIVSLLCGALAGPPAHLLVPDWSLILGGVLAGLAAFAILELTGERDAR